MQLIDSLLHLQVGNRPPDAPLVIVFTGKEHSCNTTCLRHSPHLRKCCIWSEEGMEPALRSFFQRRCPTGRTPDRLQRILVPEWRHDYCECDKRYHPDISDLVLFYVSQEELQLKTSHHICDMAGAEWRCVGDRDTCGMKHEKAEYAADVPHPWEVFKNTLMLSHQIRMREFGCFWKPCRSTTIQSSSCPFFRRFRIVESHPILLTVFQQRRPGLEPLSR